MASAKGLRMDQPSHAKSGAASGPTSNIQSQVSCSQGRVGFVTVARRRMAWLLRGLLWGAMVAFCIIAVLFWHNGYVWQITLVDQMAVHDDVVLGLSQEHCLLIIASVSCVQAFLRTGSL